MGYYRSGEGSDIDEQDEALAARLGSEVDKELSVLDAELEAARAGLTLVEFLRSSLEHSRSIALENLIEWKREYELRLDYERLCAGLICPSCGSEPIKVGHTADCEANHVVS